MNQTQAIPLALNHKKEKLSHHLLEYLDMDAEVL